jgi:predicted secreted hydrolase
MAFRMRDAQGAAHWAAATLRTATGERSTFGPGDVTWRALRTWKSPRTGAGYPVEWQLQVGQAEYRIRPLMDDAELDSRGSTGTVYWEGPVELVSPEGEVLGHGYLELTGYAGELDL